MSKILTLRFTVPDLKRPGHFHEYWFNEADEDRMLHISDRLSHSLPFHPGLTIELVDAGPWPYPIDGTHYHPVKTWRAFAEIVEAQAKLI